MLLLFSTRVANCLKKSCLFSRFTSPSVHDQGEPYSHKQPGEGWLRQAEICPRHTLMKGKKCRQKKRWEDTIKKWAGIDFVSSTRAAENKIIWKGIVANSSVVPDDLPMLWDRIEK